jgi:hypothetical protein
VIGQWLGSAHAVPQAITIAAEPSRHACRSAGGLIVMAWGSARNTASPTTSPGPGWTVPALVDTVSSCSIRREFVDGFDTP